MYLQFGKQRHEEMMREAEWERLAREARRDREKRAGLTPASDPGGELRRLAAHFRESLRVRKNAG